MSAVQAQQETSWLVRYGVEAAERVRLRLFCFHYAGATASIFRSWPGALPRGVELLAVQLPGRDYRLTEPPLTDMDDIVDALAEVVPALLDRPFALFGHSLGALISFDLVRLLRERGLRQPELMIASGRNAPQFRWRDAGIESLPDHEFVAAVRGYDGTPEALLAEESLRELWLPRLRADLSVSARYAYVEDRPLECPILVMFGEEDGLVTDEGLRGWCRQTTGDVRFLPCPGNHFFLHSAQRLVLAEVRAELETRMEERP